MSDPVHQPAPERSSPAPAKPRRSEREPASAAPLRRAFAAPRPPTDGLQAVMRRGGNRAVGSLLARSHSAPRLPGPVQLDAAPGAAPKAAGAVRGAAARGLSMPSRALPHRDTLQRAFGKHRVEGLKAHISPDACADMGARAYATGDHLVFGAAPSLREVAHEAAHAIQQRGGLTLPGGVGRRGDRHELHADAVAEGVVSGKPVERLLSRYAAPGSARGGSARPVQRLTMKKARLKARSKAVYDRKAMEYEVALGKTLAGHRGVNLVAEKMLARIKGIVDAWAKFTGQRLDDVYAEEFGWRGGDGYYGAFRMSARNIKDVFRKARSKPLRSKLKIVYNAVRNNNLAKWLKVAGEELTKKSGKSISVLEQERSTTTTRLVKVKPGFAKKAGLDKLLHRREVNELAKYAESEKEAPIDPEVRHGRRVHVRRLKKHSDILKWKDKMRRSGRDRIGGVMGGTPTLHQRTLTVREVPDLTSEEAEHLDELDHRPVLRRGPSSLDRFKEDHSDEKLPWEQGSMYYRVDPRSSTATEARKIRAHLEAGISGSTDLMLHASRYLGMGSLDDQRWLRLAMLGWMLPNRDHSFYEIMKSAEFYGLPFIVNAKKPGQEYQHPTNFTPLKVGAFKKLLPENKYPAWFLTQTYQRSIEPDLHDRTGDLATMRTYFEDAGVPGTVASGLTQSQAAWLDALEMDVDHLLGELTDGEDSRLTVYEAIRRTPGYAELTRAGLPADGFVNTLSEAHAARVFSGVGINLAELGLGGQFAPLYIDLLALRVKVQGAGFDSSGTADRRANAREAVRLRTLPIANSLAGFLGTRFELIFAALLREVGGGVESAGYDRVAFLTPATVLMDRGVPSRLAMAFASNPVALGQMNAALNRVDVFITNSQLDRTHLDPLATTYSQAVSALDLRSFKTILAGYAVRQGGTFTAGTIWHRYAEMARLITPGAITESGDEMDIEYKESLRRSRDTQHDLDFRWDSKITRARNQLAYGVEHMGTDWETTHGTAYNGLSDAELLGIMEYSRLGGMGAWQSALADLDPSKRRADALGAMTPMMKSAIAGLQRLPVHGGTVYNGQRFDASAPGALSYVWGVYPPGTVIRQDNFLSAAKSFTSSFGYKPDYDMVWVISNIKTGRDIQPISTNFGEEEVLFAPGARLMVTGIQHITNPMHEMNGKIVVKMREV